MVRLDINVSEGPATTSCVNEVFILSTLMVDIYTCHITLNVKSYVLAAGVYESARKINITVSDDIKLAAVVELANTTNADCVIFAGDVLHGCNTHEVAVAYLEKVANILS